MDPIIVAIGVFNSWDREFNNVLYSLIVFSFSSLSLTFFSTSLILYVKVALTSATTKYMKNKNASSDFAI